MARTVPSVIGSSNVWPVRLSVTVSVSPPAAARSPDRCSVGVVMQAVCPRPSESNAGRPKRAASGAQAFIQMTMPMTTTTSVAPAPMTPRAAPSPFGHAGRVNPTTLIATANRASAMPKMKNGVSDLPASVVAAMTVVSRPMGGKLPRGAAACRATLVAALGGLDLAVVVAPEVRMAIGPLGGRVERHERQLRDRQPGPQLDRDAGQVGDLERQRAREPGVDEASGRMDDETEAPQRALALDAGDDVVGQHDVLLRPGQDELARMHDERLVRAEDDLLGQVARRIAEVDRPCAVVVEHAEGRAEAQVDRGRLDHRRIPRIDLDPPLLHEAADRAVGEHGLHGARVYGPGQLRCVSRPSATTVRVRAGDGGGGSACGPRRGGCGVRGGRGPCGQRFAPPPSSLPSISGVDLIAHQTMYSSAPSGSFRTSIMKMKVVRSTP